MADTEARPTPVPAKNGAVAAALSPVFVRRVLFLVGVGLVLLVAWKLLDVLLLVFGAILVAVLLRSLANPIHRLTPLPEGLSLLAAGLIIIALLTGAGWLFGATVTQQIQELIESLPQSPEEFQARLAQLPLAGEISAQLENFDMESARSAAGPIQSILGQVGGFAMTAAGALTNLLVVIFAGIYLAISPLTARDGLLSLVPAGPREPVRHAMNVSGNVLRRWLLGQFVSMTIVGVLTGLGVWMIGLPSPVALGLFAAIAAFVPIVGPIVSVVPAVMLALQDGPMMVVWTILVYIIVQQIESNLTYPLIQRKAVDLPPALTLFSVLGFGVLFGPLGVVFAAPLLVVLFVMVKILYIRNTLGEPANVPGE
ncbi:AI-2E family transporter [Phenylobacterium sp.]|uniref:AI-2E family transporter n=1 Tax=Phenylobacterium sp. TaxID=1871053 RepID=UPI0027311F37|nr:AI-2E family transporter [Phenylobacterium sp.]MDP1874840.1 AI-2E family transporter [Phenylobacterium sp.]MDP3488654.1 AI-2E family transporter [Phenylobacterium sp.]